MPKPNGFKVEVTVAVTNPEGVKTMSIDYMEDDVSPGDVVAIEGAFGMMLAERIEEGKALAQ